MNLKNFICPKHPKYKGIRKPRSCKACKALYDYMQGKTLIKPIPKFLEKKARLA